MKFFARYIKLFSLLLLFTIFLLQGIWLFQTFHLHKKNLKEELEREFIYAIQSEANFRELERQTAARNGVEAKQNFVFNTEKNIAVFPVNIMILEALHFYNCPFSIDNILAIIKNKNNRTESIR